MILRGRDLPEENRRKPYPLPKECGVLQHFVQRVTLPDNPFEPHRHEGAELWYIQDGEAILTLDGDEHRVESGDLIVLLPNVEHGLRTDSRVTWICMA